jgi:UDP-N-acetyl-D-mannosaminuronic acid dehydrogenase
LADRSIDREADVVVVGCGVIGLAIAVALAGAGRRVLGVDVDAEKLSALNHARLDALEEGLEPALRDALVAGALGFGATAPAVDRYRTFIIATPTPASEVGFDSRALDGAMAQVAATARPGDLVCVRSTVPIGTTRVLAASAPALRFAACPDRTVSGRAYAELFEAPHLVGGLDAEAGDLAEALLAPLGPTVRTPDPETAEAIKLFANVERDVRFAVANQFALICDATGVDFDAVRSLGAAGYPRFSPARPGPVGGPCLTKDVHVLAASAALSRTPLDLLRSARRLNQTLVARVAAQVLAEAARGPIAILGLGFKGVPPTRDVRGGFGGELREALIEAKPDLEVRTWDPVLEPDPAIRDLALNGAAQVVLANDHPEIAPLDAFREHLAPGAVIHDPTGRLAGCVIPPGLTVRRLGAGRP